LQNKTELQVRKLFLSLPLKKAILPSTPKRKKKKKKAHKRKIPRRKRK
jgi:hypothetical protein